MHEGEEDKGCEEAATTRGPDMWLSHTPTSYGHCFVVTYIVQTCDTILRNTKRGQQATKTPNKIYKSLSNDRSVECLCE